MNMQPLKRFKELQRSYPQRVIRITQNEISNAPGSFAGEYMREYINRRFKTEHGMEVTRWVHDYNTLEGPEPKMGLVYMVGESVIEDVMEVWGLIGHNLKEWREAR